MRNSIFIFGILIFFIINLSSLGYAQNTSLTFGIRGGLNLANISEELLGIETLDIEGIPITVNFDQKMRTTFGFGGFLEYWMSPTIALQMNALYIKKGVLVEADFNTTIEMLGIPVNIDGNVESTTDLSYLSFPILGKLILGNEGEIRPYLLVGPEIGFLLSAEEQSDVDMTISLDEDSFSETFKETIDIKDEFESIEIALNFGAGLVIPMGNTDLFLDARYGLGLTKINKDGDDDIKNNVIYINCGFIF